MKPPLENMCPKCFNRLPRIKSGPRRGFPYCANCRIVLVPDDWEEEKENKAPRLSSDCS